MPRVLHVSDTHFLRDPAARAAREGATAYERMVGELGDVTGGVRACLAQGLAARPDLVVFTGDLTDDGDADDYRALRALFDEELARAGVPGLPVLVTPGNHDRKDALRQGWLGQDAAEADAPLHGVTEVGGVAFVALDSAAHDVPDGAMDEARAAWLAGALAGLGETPAVLVTHHHLDPGQFATPAVACPPALWEALAAHRVRTILCGHTHHQMRGQVRGITYLTAQGLSFQGDDLPQGGGVRFVCAYGYGLYDLDAAGRVRHVETHVHEDGRELGCVMFR